MASLVQREVTQLLIELSDGKRDALDRLFPIVYAELRQVARRELARERPGHTLDSCALVHEAYLRLVDQQDAPWESRAYFFAAATRAMRAILVDYARSRAAAKRGSGLSLVPLDELSDVLPDSQVEHVLAIDDALTRLAAVDAEASQTVECRYFGGLTLEEIAAVLGTSVATVRRRWAFAKAWLHRELSQTA